MHARNKLIALLRKTQVSFLLGEQPGHTVSGKVTGTLTSGTLSVLYAVWLLEPGVCSYFFLFAITLNPTCSEYLCLVVPPPLFTARIAVYPSPAIADVEAGTRVLIHWVTCPWDCSSSLPGPGGSTRWRVHCQDPNSLPFSELPLPSWPWYQQGSFGQF